jgi:GntR family transcriptional repressor for pyruvate dehydrogenase complex
MDVSGLRRARVESLSDAVADQIGHLIISQGLEVGSRLPSERELAARLGTSRPTISQALRRLALMGLVESRRGSGVYITRRPQSTIAASINMMIDLQSGSVGHLADLRLSLELLGAGTAASRSADADFEVATAARGALRDATGDTAAWIRADTRFHVEVISLSSNPYLTSIFEGVHSALITHQYQRWVDDGTAPDWLGAQHAEAQFRLHEPILQAIVQGDAESAQRAVHDHHRTMTGHFNFDGAG